MPYPYYGWGMPFHRPFGFGFGLFGFLFTIFLFFIALRALRVLLWGPRWGHPMGHHRYGPWGRWENGAPPMRGMAQTSHGQPEEKKE
jgi:hypothetical protein